MFGLENVPNLLVRGKWGNGVQWMAVVNRGREQMALWCVRAGMSPTGNCQPDKVSPSPHKPTMHSTPTSVSVAIQGNCTILLITHFFFYPSYLANPYKDRHTCFCAVPRTRCYPHDYTSYACFCFRQRFI